MFGFKNALQFAVKHTGNKLSAFQIVPTVVFGRLVSHNFIKAMNPWARDAQCPYYSIVLSYKFMQFYI